MVERSSRELSEVQRISIFADLKAQWDGTKIKWGAKSRISKKYGVDRKTVWELWKRGSNVSEPEEARVNMRSKKKDRVGRKKVDETDLISALIALPIRSRRTYRHAAKSTGYSRQAIWNAKHMECSMKVEGGNNFKEPHMNKSHRRAAGGDIQTFTCSEEAYNIANAKLDAN